MTIGKRPQYWRITTFGDVKPPYNRLINLLHTEVLAQVLTPMSGELCKDIKIGFIYIRNIKYPEMTVFLNI